MTTPTITTLGISAPSLSYGQKEVFTATVTTDPPGAVTPAGGTVSFMEGSTTLGGATLTNGTAQFGTTALGAGIHVLTAVYSGTGEFGGSSTPATPTSIINTVAGGGLGDGGLATAALVNPSGVAADAAGDVFITDTINNRIREVNHATGVITTVAGDGYQGYSGDGGPATAAELNGPTGVAVDSSGDLFFADSSNSVIREVAHATGVITTVAGGGNGGSSYGGPATDAALRFPGGVAVDSSGDLLIADTSNSRIREVDRATGVITTVAGGGRVGLAVAAAMAGRPPPPSCSSPWA